ncbi:hypothetical protein ACNO7T_08055 [Vibrio campbellii]
MNTAQMLSNSRKQRQPIENRTDIDPLKMDILNKQAEKKRQQMKQDLSLDFLDCAYDEDAHIEAMLSGMTASEKDELSKAIATKKEDKTPTATASKSSQMKKSVDIEKVLGGLFR